MKKREKNGKLLPVCTCMYLYVTSNTRVVLKSWSINVSFPFVNVIATNQAQNKGLKRQEQGEMASHLWEWY